MDRDRPERFLPLKPLVLDVLLELADGKRHGWSLIRDIQQRDGGDSILPANFYRTLRALARRRVDRRSARVMPAKTPASAVNTSASRRWGPRSRGPR